MGLNDSIVWRIVERVIRRRV